MHLEKEDITANIKTFVKKCEKITGKVFGDVSNPLLIDISGLNKGIYMLDVECENQINNFKIIKQ
jgi:hypothetical protein